MAWTPAQLKPAIAALVSPPADLQGKADALNAQAVTGSIPTHADVTGYQLLGCIHYAEFTAITAEQRSWLMALVQMPLIPGGSASFFIAPLFGALFAQMPLTVASLTALAQALTVPVWQPPVTAGDIQTALAQP